uniref:autocrine proliferation repressor protein A-like n=1 Tax=Euleptes europaea TaxID=460621 RepID=UPI0025416961|nr:autocrine proliferation repressor protein A-like [Euleptes europaea]
MHPLTLSLFAAFLPTVWLMDQKALDEFVNLPDPHYNYTITKREKIGFLLPFNFDTINMTSQKWLDDHFTFQKKRLGRAVATLKPALIQPLTFYNHPLGRKNITGYDIVAYTWWRFINDPTAPPHWLVQFPMVKATVRAMDTITVHMKKKYGVEISEFTLAGISLGGWISWLTAAVDRRVKGIVPIAMDFLNFKETFHHQYRAYCGWSYMLRPFHEMNITQELDNPRFSDLASHVDPLAYNERYTNVAKYIIVLSGDEFFQPDNSQYYFSQLEGVKFLQIQPNTDYGNQTLNQLFKLILPFHRKLLEKEIRFPIVSWEIKMTNTSGTIYFTTFNTNKVYSYHADTVGGTRRDFRMKIAAGNSSQDNPVKWIQTDVETLDIGVYKKEMPRPAKGWRGFFIQATHAEENFDTRFVATSGMLIMPDTFPCPDCNGDGCRGTLV